MVKTPDAGKQLAFPVRVVLPEIGEQYGVPYGVQVNGAACLRVDALAALFGAKWSEAAPAGTQTVTLNGHTVSATPAPHRQHSIRPRHAERAAGAL